MLCFRIKDASIVLIFAFDKLLGFFSNEDHEQLQMTS